MMSQNGSETNLEFWVKNGQSYSLVTTLQVPTATLNSVSFGDLSRQWVIQTTMEVWTCFW